MPQIDIQVPPPSYIVIPKPIDASVCNVERIVNKVISHSPELVNKYPSSTRFMNPLMSEKCPTYSEIKRCKNLSVTLYNKDEENYDKIIYVEDKVNETVDEVKVKDEKTVKFTGEVGQLPELYVNGMLPGTTPVIDGMVYDSNNLVLLDDVNAIYKEKKVTIKLHGFKPFVLEKTIVQSSGAVRWTADLIYTMNVLTEDTPFDAPTDPFDVIFTTLSGTACWFKFEKPSATKPRIMDLGTKDTDSGQDYLKFDLNGFTMRPNGCCLTENSGTPASQVGPNYDTIDFKFGKYYYIKNLSSDATIDIYAKKNNTVIIFISTDDSINLYDVLNTDFSEILISPTNYMIYNTTDRNPNTILFRPSADTEIYESIGYVLTECNPLTGEETEVLTAEGLEITSDLRISFDQLKNTPITDETTGQKMYYYYTLNIHSVKKYVPPIINLITTEDVNNLIVAITDEAPPAYDGETDYINYYKSAEFNEYYERHIKDAIPFTKSGKNYIYSYEKKKNQTNYYILTKILNWSIISNQQLIYSINVTDGRNRVLSLFWNERDSMYASLEDVVPRFYNDIDDETGDEISVPIYNPNIIWKWTDDERDNFSWYLRYERVKFILMKIQRNTFQINVIDNLSPTGEMVFPFMRRFLEHDYQSNYSRPHDLDFTIYIGPINPMRPGMPTGYEDGYLSADLYFRGSRLSKYSKIVKGNERMQFAINNLPTTGMPSYDDYTLKLNAIKGYNDKQIYVKIPKNDSVSGIPFINANVAYMHRIDEEIGSALPRFECVDVSDEDYYIYAYYVSRDGLPIPPAEYAYTYFSLNISQINYGYEKLYYSITTEIIENDEPIEETSELEELVYEKPNWNIDCDFYINQEASTIIINIEPVFTRTYDFYVIGQPGLTISTDYNGMEPVVISDEVKGYGDTSNPLSFRTPTKYNKEIALSISRTTEDYTGFTYKLIYYLSSELESFNIIHTNECYFYGNNNTIKWPDVIYSLNDNWTEKIAVAFYIDSVKYKTYDIYAVFSDTYDGDGQSGYQTILTDDYNPFWSVTSNTAGTKELYTTVVGHIRDISWNLTLPDNEPLDNSSYDGYMFDIYYSQNKNAEPDDPSWEPLTSTDRPSTHLEWSIGTLIDGSPTSTKGEIYCVRITVSKRPTTTVECFRAVAIVPSKQEFDYSNDQIEIYTDEQEYMYLNSAVGCYTHVYFQSYVEEYEMHGSTNVLKRRYLININQGIPSAVLQNIKLAGDNNTDTASNIKDFLTGTKIIQVATNSNIYNLPTLKMIDSNDVERVIPYSHYVSIKTVIDFYKQYRTIDNSSFVYTDYPFTDFLKMTGKNGDRTISINISAKAYPVRSISRIGTGNGLSVKSSDSSFKFTFANKEIVKDGITTRSKEVHMNDFTVDVDNSTCDEITTQPNCGWLFDSSGFRYIADGTNQYTYEVLYKRDPNNAPAKSFNISIEKYLRKYVLNVTSNNASPYNGYYVMELNITPGLTNLYHHTNIERPVVEDLYICINRKITGYNETTWEPIYSGMTGGEMSAGTVFIDIQGNNKYVAFGATNTAVIHLRMLKTTFNENGASFKIYFSSASSYIYVNEVHQQSAASLNSLEQNPQIRPTSGSNRVYDIPELI